MGKMVFFFLSLFKLGFKLSVKSTLVEDNCGRVDRETMNPVLSCGTTASKGPEGGRHTSGERWAEETFPHGSLVSY